MADQDKAVHAARSSRLRVLLQTWHASIRKATPPHCIRNIAVLRDHSEISGVLLIHVEPVTRSVLEGLELLSLLVHADWQMWEREIEAIWPADVTTWGDFVVCSRLTKLGISLVITADAEGEAALDILAKTGRASTYSPAFVEAKAILQAMLAERGHVVTEVPVHIVCFEPKRFQMQFKILQSVVKQQHFYSLQQQHLENVSGFGGLRVRSMDLRLGSQALDIKSLEGMMDIAATGVSFVNMGTIGADVYRDHPRMVAHTMATTFDIARTRPCGIQDFEFGVSHLTNHDQVASIFSAAHANTSLREVTVSFNKVLPATPRDTRDRVWSWTAHALFGRSHTIPSLWMCTRHLDLEDVDAMRRVLDAQDPIATLLPRSSTDTISASRFWLLDPRQTDSDAVKNAVYQSAEELHGLAVLEPSQVWTSVLLPGWGQAWVHQDDIHSRQQCVVPAPVQIRSIPRVMLFDISAESQKAVMAFLGLVGRGIRGLAISSSKNELQGGDWCRQLFQSCPNLECLSFMNVALDSMQVFTDGYLSGSCRLRYLGVDIESGSAACDGGLTTFFQALGDRHHPAARYLTELSVYYSTAGDPTAVVTSLIAMLQKNDQLYELSLTMAGMPASAVREIKRRIVSEVPEINRVTSSRLGLAARLAFLSVVTHSRHTTAATRMDGCVLALIFAFAATRRTRHVEIRKSLTTQ